MVRIRVFKLSQIIYTGLVAALAITVLVLLISAFPSSGSAAVTPSPPPRQLTPAPTVSPAPSGTNTLTQGALYNDAPVFAASALSKPSQAESASVKALSWLSRAVLGVDLTDPADIPAAALNLSASDVVAMASAKAAGLSDAPVQEEHEETDEVPEHIDIQISRIDPTFEPTTRVSGSLSALIYHTHTHEAYAQIESDLYKETSKWRTQDYTHSIVRVGEELAQQLSQRGMDVLHDRTDHEPPKLGTAYTRSLETLEGYEERGEEFDLYIDIHRDAYSANWDKPLSTVMIDGKECARIMLLIGNGEGFNVKPEWEENYKLAQSLTDELNKIAPGFARPVMVKNGRYNQHISTQAILIEVGHNMNQLEQCLNSMPYLAEALAKVMEDD